MQTLPQEDARLTCSLPGFPANPTALPASEEARAMTVRSGRDCLRLLKFSDPLFAFSKTLLESSAWNSTLCFLTWKVSATPVRHRLLFQLAVSMPRTGETGSGLWAT